MLPTTKLTARQESFCQHLVDGLNQTEAYEAAGYSVDNKLPATVYQAASRLAANSKVIARIQELRDAVQERALVTAVDILTELKGIGMADLSQLVSWDKDSVTVKDSDDLPPELTRLVSEVSQTVTKDGGTVKIKLHDKIAALDKMAKTLGMYEEKKTPDTSVTITKVTVVLSGPAALRQAEIEGRVVDGSVVDSRALDPSEEE